MEVCCPSYLSTNRLDSHFSLVASKGFFVFKLLTGVPLDVDLCIYPNWSWLSGLDVKIRVFH